jgi:hypothetical protein
VLVSSAPSRAARTVGRARELAHGRDLAVGYAALVVLSAVVVFTQPRGDASQAVLDSSTNLHNLQTQPLLVLLLSAFVVSSPWSLWVLPVLVWAYGTAQQWLGRRATVLVALFGHVFATVFVAVMLTAGIAHHQLSRDLAREPDVGVSYGLAAVLGLLVHRLPPRRRHRVVPAVTVVLLVLVGVSQTLTDLGHLVAWCIGLTMGFVGTRLADARDGQPRCSDGEVDEVGEVGEVGGTASSG